MPNILELAKQGDPQAIAALMNRHLQPKDITAKVTLKDEYLQVILESAQVPNQQDWMAFIRQGITNLSSASIKKVKVYGRQTGGDFIAWSEQFELMAGKISTSPIASPPVTHTHESPNQVKEVTFPKNNQSRNILTVLVIMGLLYFCSTQSNSNYSSCSSANDRLSQAESEAASFTTDNPYINEGNLDDAAMLAAKQADAQQGKDQACR